jgi:hypothetical protein
MLQMKTSLDWTKQALLDYADTLPKSAQQPVLACADYHVRAIEKDLAELASLKQKIASLESQMDNIGAPAGLEG